MRILEFRSRELYDFSGIDFRQVSNRPGTSYDENARICELTERFTIEHVFISDKQPKNGIAYPMPNVKFVNEKKTIEVPEGANLRKEALKAGIELYPGIHAYLNCHGLRQCGSCRVMIKKGVENISRQGFLEKLRLIAGPLTYFARIGNEDTLRLACATRVMGDIEVETKPGVNLHGERFWG